LKQKGKRGRVELGARRGSKSGNEKWEGNSGNHDNAFEAGAQSERAEQEFESKIFPFSSFFFVVFLCGVVATKKARTTCLLLYD